MILVRCEDNRIVSGGLVGDGEERVASGVGGARSGPMGFRSPPAGFSMRAGGRGVRTGAFGAVQQGRAARWRARRESAFGRFEELSHRVVRSSRIVPVGLGGGTGIVLGRARWRWRGS